MKLKDKILQLKKQKDAVIVAHNYQQDDIQEIADVVGDSLVLSQYCNKVKSSLIVFCGVLFMAESAKILAPDKKVLLPETDAGCSLADMITPEDVKKLRKQNPGAAVVCYINSSADVKAESDVCCTSSNALKVIKSLKQDKIIFIPDKNLGSYIASKTPEKQIILWEGSCEIHYRLKKEDALRAKKLHKGAKMLVHPECGKEVVEEADFVGSTGQIIKYVSESPEENFIIATEKGILYTLKKNNPSKNFYMITDNLICDSMKKISLESLYNSLKFERHIINVEEAVAKRARKALDRMLEICQ